MMNNPTDEFTSDGASQSCITEGEGLMTTFEEKSVDKSNDKKNFSMGSLKQNRVFVSKLLWFAANRKENVEPFL